MMVVALVTLRTLAVVTSECMYISLRFDASTSKPIYTALHSLNVSGDHYMAYIHINGLPRFMATVTGCGW